MPFPTDALLRIERWGSAVAVSPDGTKLVYVADRNGRTQLYLRRVDQFDATPIPGTIGANGPFFSPDSQWLGFFLEDKLMKTSLADGRLLAVCDIVADRALGGSSRGATWTDDGTIIFGQTSYGLLHVPSSGGKAEVLSKVGLWPDAMPGGKDVLLTILNQQGKTTALPFPPGLYDDARLSPAGDRLALTVNGQEVWVYDVVRGTRTRLTSGQAASFEAIWKSDGTRVAFSSRRAGVANIFSQLADGRGEAERLTTSDYDQYTSSWASDGKILFFAQFGRTGGDTWILHLDSAERKTEPFLNEPYSEWSPKISPDDALLAYVSDESGRPEVYVQSFPDRNLKIPISTEGGTEPLWRRDGRVLYYRNGDKLMAVSFVSR